jgi:hypothetical protein
MTSTGRGSWPAATAAASAPATDEAALPPEPSGLRDALAQPDAHPSSLAERMEHRLRGDGHDVLLRLARDELGVQARDLFDRRRPVHALEADLVARSLHGQAEHVEPGSDVADARGREDGGHQLEDPGASTSHASFSS